MSSMAANNSDLRAQQLLSSYMRAGYTPIDPPVLQPAEPFLDLSGEDIRRRMFLTSDPHGRELSLGRQGRGLLLFGRGVSPSRRRGN
jgi:ATP phosphoribosyltransferase regulatory subunit